MELELSEGAVTALARWLAGESVPESVPGPLDEGVEAVKLDGYLILRGFRGQVSPLPKLVFRINAVRAESNIRVTIDVKV